MDNDWIEIKIEDPALFTHIALIVDRPKVRKEVSLLRKKWANKKPGMNLEFNKDINTLLRTNKLSPAHFYLIEQTILKGFVTKHPRVTHIVIPRDMLEDIVQLEMETIDNENYEYAILTPIEATEEEVVQQFRSMKQAVKKSLERNYPPQGAQELNQPMSDTISNIKRDRKWYWMHQPKSDGGEGMSYYRIALKEPHQTKDSAWQHKELVRKAIKQYEIKLNINLYPH